MSSAAPSLRPFQKKGVTWLTGRRTALLAWEQGLGKTPTSLRAAVAVGALVVVVICPAVARINWHRECEKWAPFLRLYAYSYDEISRNGPLHVLPDQIDVLILDESHYLKEGTSKRTKNILGTLKTQPNLIERAERVWCLSGTPTPNNVGEIWPIAYTLFPENVTIIGAGSRPAGPTGFRDYYCYTRPTRFGTQIMGHRRDKLGELRDKLKPHVNRLKKVDVLPELPPLQASVVTVEANTALVTAEILRLGREKPEIHAALERLRTTGDLTFDSPHLATLRRLTGQIKAPLVAELVTESLTGGGKAVVFAQHRSVIAALQAAFSSLGVVVIDGQTSPNDRQRAIDTFQTDPQCRVFVGNITAAGTAITLTAASNVWFAEASWVPADNAQAVARAHRMGQDMKVLARFVSLAGTIDEVVMRTNVRKIRDLKTFWEDADEIRS